jgi:hypothetical protein
MHVEHVAVGRRLAVALIGDAVLHRQFGTDQRLAADLHEFGVLEQRPDDVAGQLGGLGAVEDVPELLRVARDDIPDPVGQQ